MKYREAYHLVRLGIDHARPWQEIVLCLWRDSLLQTSLLSRQKAK
jgi:hypothetical protein